MTASFTHGRAELPAKPPREGRSSAGPEGPLGGQADSVSQASPSRWLPGALCKAAEAASCVTGKHTQLISDVCLGCNIDVLGSLVELELFLCCPSGPGSGRELEARNKMVPELGVSPALRGIQGVTLGKSIVSPRSSLVS